MLVFWLEFLACLSDLLVLVRSAKRSELHMRKHLQNRNKLSDLNRLLESKKIGVKKNKLNCHYSKTWLEENLKQKHTYMQKKRLV
ncbi:hypothetical protein L2E82_49829 [Cichorium intybus]|uniref:Uncharacterized protein n=1 Tax=Cichorium intybus TaxID=13427 RepID=A0ACB8Z0G3_CICIN|nr:hypothetical protein L2E82_49829 [Cichorium intybus]